MRCLNFKNAVDWLTFGRDREVPYFLVTRVDPMVQAEANEVVFRDDPVGLSRYIDGLGEFNDESFEVSAHDGRTLGYITLIDRPNDPVFYAGRA